MAAGQEVWAVAAGDFDGDGLRSVFSRLLEFLLPMIFALHRGVEAGARKEGSTHGRWKHHGMEYAPQQAVVHVQLSANNLD